MQIHHSTGSILSSCVDPRRQLAGAFATMLLNRGVLMRRQLRCFLVLLTFLLALASQAFSQIKLVQHGSTDNGSASTTSVVVTLNGVASGDLLTCSLTFGNPGGTTVSASDNVNGSWSVANAAHYNPVIGKQPRSSILPTARQERPPLPLRLRLPRRMTR